MWCGPPARVPGTLVQEGTEMGGPASVEAISLVLQALHSWLGFCVFLFLVFSWFQECRRETVALGCLTFARSVPEPRTVTFLRPRWSVQ